MPKSSKKPVNRVGLNPTVLLTAFALYVINNFPQSNMQTVKISLKALWLGVCISVYAMFV